MNARAVEEVNIRARKRMAQSYNRRGFLTGFLTGLPFSGRRFRKTG
jgi:hypothetical protein